MTIKSVEFVFENCETLQVPIEFIKYMWFGGVNKSVTLNIQTKTLQEKEVINKLYISFMPKFKDSGIKTHYIENDGYERLKKYSDITWIHIHNQDKSEIIYGVNWKDENNHYTNTGQSSQEDEWGLVLEVDSK